jgi:hypothetical protein
MSDNQKTQHEQLIAAGWRYDAATDRYSAPGAATDGTARMYNVSAAWQAMQLDTASEPTGTTPPRGTRMADPRSKEPE